MAAARPHSAAALLLLLLLGGALPAGSADTPAPPASLSPDASALNNEGVAKAKAGQFEEGVALVRQALALNPQDATFRTNLSGMLTDFALLLERRGAVERAMEALHEATQVNPANGHAWVRLGDLAYLKQHDLEAALRAWRSAYGRVPSARWPEVASRIARVQRDRLIERGYVAQRTDHFDILVQSRDHPAVAALGTRLEAEYARQRERLGGGPSRVTVIIYTERDLRRVYTQRDWALGFYDGRIRLTLDDLGGEQQRVLVAHELAHAFLHHAFGLHLPTWIHEGYAQVCEGDRPRAPEEQALEERIRARTAWVPLAWLDRRFEQPSGQEDILRAYVQSWMVVRELIDRHGHQRFTAFLTRLAAGHEIAAAYDEVFTPSRWANANQGTFE